MKQIAVILCTLTALLSHNLLSATEPQISLLTAYPGSIIYELEGHSMLRVVDPSDSTDICFSWGVFDFNQDDFVYRFVKGETDYMCAAYPTALALSEYQQTGRRVVEQQLQLSAQQKQKLINLLHENLMPQNRVYRYNYVLDNCATRPLALIEKATGEPLTFVESIADGGDTTFRKMMREYHRNYPWYQFGIDLALGSGIDRTISVRETAFAPVRLQQLLSNAKIGERLAVGKSEILLPGPEQGTTEPPTPWYETPICVLSILSAIGICLLASATVKHRKARMLTTIYFGGLFIVSILLTFLIFMSTHEATSPNWLYLWCNPLALIPAVAVWLKKCNKLLISYHFVNFVAIIALIVVASMGVQSINAAVWPLVALDGSISIATIYTLIHKQL